MKNLRHASGVDRSLRALRVAVQRALKGLNQAAAQAMGKGRYAAAEELAAKGRDILQFQAEVAALHVRWREVRGGRGRTKAPAKPLWEYYQPILRALVEAGGQCRRVDLEPRVERIVTATEGDGVPGDRSDRCRAAIGRAKKYLVREGWIEPRGGKVWTITDAGRRVAEKAIGRSTVAEAT